MKLSINTNIKNLALLFGLSLWSSSFLHAQICASAQLQLNQRATTERQAFIANMGINNSMPVDLDALVININFTDSTGATVMATSDASNTKALFFIRINDGSSLPSKIVASSASQISWLIIPAPGAGGTDLSGQQYNVGATVSYTQAGVQKTIVVTPATITVQPLPSLSLDYFLPQYVLGDDPTTPQTEPLVPFSLGLRVKNYGPGTANSLQIQTTQPVISTNVQGLNGIFNILTEEVNGLTQGSPTLLANLGDVLPNTTSDVRWNMTSRYMGQFVNFSATFTHADSLGGRLTSLIQNVSTHTLIHDVLVDTSGSDAIRDFLAQDADGSIKVYGSDGYDLPVYNGSSFSLIAKLDLDLLKQTSDYLVTPPANPKALYVQVTDPLAGAPLTSGQIIYSVTRYDGVTLNPNNYWRTEVYNRASHAYSYYLSIFDVQNPKGFSYKIQFGPPVLNPTIKNVVDQTVTVGIPYALTINATAPYGSIPLLTTRNLPNGPTFTDNKNGTGTLKWTATPPQIGQYNIQFIATDGQTGRFIDQPVNFTVTDQSRYKAWKDKYFSGITDPNIIGDLADPAHDGLTNLVKYALNLDPTQGESGATKIGSDLVNGKHYLTLSYQVRTDDPNLSVQVAASPLSNASDNLWIPQTQTVPVDQTNVPSGMIAIKVRDSVAIEDGPVRRFLKLLVNLTGS